MGRGPIRSHSLALTPFPTQIGTDSCTDTAALSSTTTIVVSNSINTSCYLSSTTFILTELDRAGMTTLLFVSDSFRHDRDTSTCPPTTGGCQDGCREELNIHHFCLPRRWQYTPARCLLPIIVCALSSAPYTFAYSLSGWNRLLGVLVWVSPRERTYATLHLLDHLHHACK
mmetsp:Transcript_47953/g.124498  ORF Transcript_47953/g.124498 Transcript_47953/m.124498 type:complete len:171 (-) Transcript_47953:489-1001(-)